MYNINTTEVNNIKVNQYPLTAIQGAMAGTVCFKLKRKNKMVNWVSLPNEPLSISESMDDALRILLSKEIAAAVPQTTI